MSSGDLYSSTAGKLRITEHTFEVPKDYNNPSLGSLRLFARSARRNEVYPNEAKGTEHLPWMCYLQGGPGQECRAPQNYAWTETIINKGYQMLFLDQRGTGMSTPITASTLQMRGDNDVQHRYLKLFRADNIVRDCEAIRQALLADQKTDLDKKWSIFGQSFGGFCCVSYLSFFPEGLREAFLFGGLQPLVKQPDEVYRRLYKKVIERNEAYYLKFPEDVQRVKTIMNYLGRFGDGKIKLPSEGSLTRNRFQQLGLLLGFHGGIDTIHDIVLRANNDIEAFGHLTRKSLSEIDSNTSFDDALLYSILHEPIYCEGSAPAWSAERVRAEYPIFAHEQSDRPIYLTGEMIYPSMFNDYAELRKVTDVANRIAEDKDWPALYNIEQLSKNTVPVYAASYDDDMYVDQGFAMETAKAIKGCKVYRTNVMLHNAVRAKMEEVVGALFKLKEDVSD